MATLSKRIENGSGSPEPRSTAPKSILYFGCPAPERGDLETQLASGKIHVVWIESSSQAALELSRRNMPVVLDLARGGAALQVAREVRTQHPSAILFAIADYARPELTTEAVLIGVADVFGRPPAPRRIARAVDREINRQSGSASAVADDLLTSPDDLYCGSAAMRDVLPLIAQAAIAGAGALILGEGGSGRQAVARAIHHAADFNGRAGRFVVVDCAAVPSNQLAVDLFGPDPEGLASSRGPESVSQGGRLYEARGGTIFLKSVTDAPTGLQARLARLFRDREAVLLETGATIPFDVRPIVAADAGLDAAVEEGRVRDDLFRRVSAIRITVPPLRGRTEDIAALANHFVRESCAIRRVPAKMMSRSLLSLLAALPWRGNAAELKKVIEAVVATSNSSRLALEDVLMHVRLDGGAMVFSGNGTLRQARARFERDYIGAMLRQHRGRIAEAAKALGIQRPNLYRKIRALNVNRPGSRRGAA